MKKTILAIAAMAVMFGFAQCSKQPVQPHYTGYVGDLYVSDITFNATSNSSNSKVSVQSVSELLKLQWDNTDEIKVFNSSDVECGTLDFQKYGSTKAEAVFNGTVTAAKGDNLRMCYFGSENVSYNGTYNVQYNNQSGELTKASATEGLSIMENLILRNEDLIYDGENYGGEMTTPFAILFLDLSAFNNTTDPTEVLITSTGNPDVKVKNVTKDSKTMYVALPTNNPFDTKNPTKVTYTFSCDGMGYTSYEWGINQSTYYTKNNGEGVSTGEAIVIASTPGLPSHGDDQNFDAGGGLNP